MKIRHDREVFPDKVASLGPPDAELPEKDPFVYHLCIENTMVFMA